MNYIIAYAIGWIIVYIFTLGYFNSKKPSSRWWDIYSAILCAFVWPILPIVFVTGIIYKLGQLFARNY